MSLISTPPSLLLLLFVMCPWASATPFTVIMSDSGPPNALVDGPQTGFSINKDGARTDAREQEAIYDIMHATGNDWATDIPDVCRGRWHGIECMPDKDDVFHVISLSFGALSDDTAFPTCDPTRYNSQPIPSFLGRLGPTLQTLVLRDNGHMGPIPVELGNLTRLKVLDLHKNNLNGSIPVSLNRITGLRSLDLSSNSITGSIPNLSFPILSILDMSQNLLASLIPSSIGSCLALLKMDLSHNRLTGSIPDSMGGLKDLMLMDLSYNRLKGPLPMWFGTLVSLQTLNLKGNPMGPTQIPSEGFEGMKGLMILILSNMNLHGPIPPSLGNLPSLRVLHLDRNHLNGSIPNSFRELKSVAELRLNDNGLVGSIPFGREMVWRMRRKLRLYNNSGLC
ncbi:hypothetical protein ACLB2K_059334 [Fragaria x ananassa]